MTLFLHLKDEHTFLLPPHPLPLMQVVYGGVFFSPEEDLQPPYFLHRMLSENHPDPLLQQSFHFLIILWFCLLGHR